MTFFPENFTIGNSSDRYLKLKVGATRVRALAEAVTGFKAWTTDEEGKKRPVRIHDDEMFNGDEIDDLEEAKRFAAFPVWDYESKSVKIWECTQSTILKKVHSLTKNEAYGDPQNYDLYVEKSGEGMKTKYEVTANPPKAIEDEIATAWAAVQAKGFDLNMLYTNDDPWNPNKIK